MLPRIKFSKLLAAALCALACSGMARAAEVEALRLEMVAVTEAGQFYQPLGREFLSLSRPYYFKHEAQIPLDKTRKLAATLISRILVERNGDALVVRLKIRTTGAWEEGNSRSATREERFPLLPDENRLVDVFALVPAEDDVAARLMLSVTRETLGEGEAFVAALAAPPAPVNVLCRFRVSSVRCRDGVEYQDGAMELWARLGEEALYRSGEEGETDEFFALRLSAVRDGESFTCRAQAEGKISRSGGQIYFFQRNDSFSAGGGAVVFDYSETSPDGTAQNGIAVVVEAEIVPVTDAASD